jgi:hypothetical protein
MTHRPVCVRCRAEMSPKKNDYLVEEMADVSSPYKLWWTDLWRCTGCGVEIVIGFARNPDAEHFQPEYAEKAKHADLRFWPRPDMVPSEVVR